MKYFVLAHINDININIDDINLLPECRICFAQYLHRGPSRSEAHLWRPEFIAGVALYFDHDHSPQRDYFGRGLYRLNLIDAATGFAFTLPLLGTPGVHLLVEENNDLEQY